MRIRQWFDSRLLILRLACQYRKQPPSGNTGILAACLSYATTTSIAISVAGLLLGLSVLNGFDSMLSAQLLSFSPHGILTYHREGSNSPENLRQTLLETPQVAGASQYAVMRGLLHKGSKLHPAMICGVDPQSEPSITSIPRKLCGGDWKDFHTERDQIILGKTVADKLQVHCGEQVTLILQDSPQAARMRVKRIPLTVHAILCSHTQLDNTYAAVPIQDLQRYGASQKNVPIRIAIRTHQTKKTEKILQALLQQHPEISHYQSWQELFKSLQSDLKLMRSILLFCLGFTILLSSLSISSVLSITMKSRRKELGVLRTLGATPSFIRHIFVNVGVIEAMIGGTIGSLLGIVLIKLFPAVLQYLSPSHPLDGSASTLHSAVLLVPQWYYHDIATVLGLLLCVALGPIYYLSCIATRESVCQQLKKM